jgi:hypothetical protein
MRLGTLLLGCLIVSLALTGATSGANATDARTNPLITVRYSGILEAHSKLHGTHPRGPDLYDSRIQWALIWIGRASNLRESATRRFTTKRLAGNVTYVDRLNPFTVTGADRSDCTGKYSAKPGMRVPVVVTINPDNRRGYGVQLTRPTSATYLISSNKKSNYGYCTNIFGGVLPSKSQAVSPFFYFPTKGGTRPNRITYDGSTSPDDQTRTLVQESVSLTVGK